MKKSIWAHYEQFLLRFMWSLAQVWTSYSMLSITFCSCLPLLNCQKVKGVCPVRFVYSFKCVYQTNYSIYKKIHIEIFNYFLVYIEECICRTWTLQSALQCKPVCVEAELLLLWPPSCFLIDIPVNQTQCYSGVL